MASKPKCKYWDKCYQKGKTHLTQFLHPADEKAKTDEDKNDVKKAATKTDDAKSNSDVIGGTGDSKLTPTSTKPSKVKQIKLVGKTVTFLGTFGKYTADQMGARADVYGCLTTDDVAEDVDLVVIGKGPGPKELKAKRMGLRVISAEYWEQLVSRSLPPPLTRSRSRGSSFTGGAGDTAATILGGASTSKAEKTKPAKTTLKRQRTHNLSDDEDEKPSKKQPVARQDSDMDTSDENEAVRKPGDNKAAEKVPVKRKASVKKDEKADEGSSAKKAKVKKIAKCKYWEKCFRKEAKHLETFLHPGDDPSELDDGTKPLADGETADVQAGARTFHIKRTGNVYHCNCIGWKTQVTKTEDKRTCRHLKEYLGEEKECKRTGTKMPAPNKGGEATIFRAPKHKQVSVLLAHKYTEDIDPTGWWISEKLDGVRAYWDGKSFYSRLGNEFIPPPWFIQNFPENMTLDGELFGGRSKFQSTVSIVKNAGSSRWKEIEYHIFDAPSEKNGFENRIKAAKDYFKENESKIAVVVPHMKCTGRAHIVEELDKVEELGGEGLMIRKPGSLYEQKRSHTLLKIKTFYDAEAVVIGHEKGKGRNASVCGALRCRMACGKEFSVGSGLTDAQRSSPPKKGSIITYKFQEYTNSGSPRFPTFLGIRIDMDKPKDAVLPAGKLQNRDDA